MQGTAKQRGLRKGEPSPLRFHLPSWTQRYPRGSERFECPRLVFSADSVILIVPVSPLSRETKPAPVQGTLEFDLGTAESSVGRAGSGWGSPGTDFPGSAGRSSQPWFPRP